MTYKRFTLNFSGYWLEPGIVNIPNDPGIYCVYACVHYSEKNTVGIINLLYIGESENVGSRIESHDQRPTWSKVLNGLNRKLCFNFAPIGTKLEDKDRKQVEAALISNFEPPFNSEYGNDFPFEPTELTTSGSNAIMEEVIRVPAK